MDCSPAQVSCQMFQRLLAVCSVSFALCIHFPKHVNVKSWLHFMNRLLNSGKLMLIPEVTAASLRKVFHHVVTGFYFAIGANSNAFMSNRRTSIIEAGLLQEVRVTNEMKYCDFIYHVHTYDTRIKSKSEWERTSYTGTIFLRSQIQCRQITAQSVGLFTSIARTPIYGHITVIYSQAKRPCTASSEQSLNDI